MIFCIISVEYNNKIQNINKFIFCTKNKMHFAVHVYLSKLVKLVSFNSFIYL